MRYAACHCQRSTLPAPTIGRTRYRTEVAARVAGPPHHKRPSAAAESSPLPSSRRKSRRRARGLVASPPTRVDQTTEGSALQVLPLGVLFPSPELLHQSR